MEDCDEEDDHDFEDLELETDEVLELETEEVEMLELETDEVDILDVDEDEVEMLEVEEEELDILDADEASARVLTSSCHTALHICPNNVVAVGKVPSRRVLVPYDQIASHISWIVAISYTFFSVKVLFGEFISLHTAAAMSAALNNPMSWCCTAPTSG